MCDIQDVQLHGENFGSQGVPTQLRVVARVDCPAVNVEVRRNATDPTPLMTASNVATTLVSQPPPGTPPRLASHAFALTGGLTAKCGELLHVTIVCANDTTCRRAEVVLIQCKGFAGTECPTTVVVDVAPPLNQGADCMPAGSYTVTVIDPVGADIAYFWSSGAVGSPQSSLPGSGASQVIQVQGGDPQAIVTVIAMKTGCPPAPPGTVLFPAGDDVQCPTSFSVSIVQGATTVAGPHTNSQGVDWNVPSMSAGTYTVRIVAPAGGEYEWYDNNGVLVQTGPSADHSVTLAAGQSITTSFRIKPSDCCPAMLGSVTLTGVATGTPPPSTGEPPEEEPPEQEPPGGGFDFCAFLRFIVGIALVGTLLSVVASACLVLVAAAIPALIATAIAAVVAAILMLLICRPSVCRLVGVLVWAFKWAIVLGTLLAMGCGSILSFFVVVIYGGIIAALIWFLIGRGCRVPRMLDMP